MTDADLLQRFVSRREEAAFELLVRRHGPMVLGVCQRVLRDPHDAEDSFQAVWLALACKAGSIVKNASVGSWLYKVAYRVALRARTRRQLRTVREWPAAESLALASTRDTEAAGRRELRGIIDEELDRLPEKYRAPLVLCYLEGLTNEGAARQLRCPAGTIKTRLARARQLLGDRLLRRGVTLGAGVLAAETLAAAASAGVPAQLAGATVRAAVVIAEGHGTVAGVASTAVTSLTEGVLRTMLVMKLKMTALVLAACLVVAGGGVASLRSLAGEPAATEGEQAATPTDAAARVRQIKKQIADLQAELRQAELAAARDRAAAERQVPVAVIFQTMPITREELGMYLLVRLSAERLEGYINLRILEHACGQKGITVSEAEIEAALRDDRRTLVNGDDLGFQNLLRDRQRTLFEWKQDVIRPRLLMRKLCHQRARVTEEDLRNAYEASYGEKVECQVILWPSEEEEKAAQLRAALVRHEKSFDAVAGAQSSSTLAAQQGRIRPFGRHGIEDKELEKVAFGLQPGEISPVVQTPQGLALIKCIGRIPANPARRFEEVKESLRKEVRDRLVDRESPQVFKELREQAMPQLLWRPESGAEKSAP